jgi:hypothetical protein
VVRAVNTIGLVYDKIGEVRTRYNVRLRRVRAATAVVVTAVSVTAVVVTAVSVTAAAVYL